MTKTWLFEHWLDTSDNTRRGKNVNAMNYEANLSL